MRPLLNRPSEAQAGARARRFLYGGCTATNCRKRARGSFERCGAVGTPPQARTTHGRGLATRVDERISRAKSGSCCS